MTNKRGDYYGCDRAGVDVVIGFAEWLRATLSSCEGRLNNVPGNTVRGNMLPASPSLQFVYEVCRIASFVAMPFACRDSHWRN